MITLCTPFTPPDYAKRKRRSAKEVKFEDTLVSRGLESPSVFDNAMHCASKVLSTIFPGNDLAGCRTESGKAFYSLNGEPKDSVDQDSDEN